MSCTRHARARTGQAFVPEVEWLIRLPRVPFFWFVMRNTAVVAV